MLKLESGRPGRAGVRSVGEVGPNPLMIAI
jgi:hypothetical protein